MTENVTIEKQVWESTLNCSMVTQAENTQLKKWCEEFNALEVYKENTKLKELLKECRDEIEYLRKHYKGKIDHLKNNTRLDKEISQALGEE